MDDQTLLVSVEEAARRLGIARSRIFALIAAEEIESLKIGRSRRIPVQALEMFVAARRTDRAPDGPDG